MIVCANAALRTEKVPQIVEKVAGKLEAWRGLAWHSSCGETDTPER